MQAPNSDNRRWRPIPLIGLTGGIACGKTTVLKSLEAQGVLCMNADTIYADLVRAGSPLLTTIAEIFGSSVIRSDGSLNRQVLGSLVFSDKAAMEKLNRITHPAILDEAIQRLVEAEKKGVRWAVFEAAILVEGNSHQEMDFLVVVSAPNSLRLQRIMGRDGLSREQAQARIDAQVPLSTYEGNADYVVQNTDGLQELSISSKALYEALVNQLGNPRHSSGDS